MTLPTIEDLRDAVRGRLALLQQTRPKGYRRLVDAGRGLLALMEHTDLVEIADALLEQAADADDWADA